MALAVHTLCESEDDVEDFIHQRVVGGFHHLQDKRKGWQRGRSNLDVLMAQTAPQLVACFQRRSFVGRSKPKELVRNAISATVGCMERCPVDGPNPFCKSWRHVVRPTSQLLCLLTHQLACFFRAG